MGNQSLPLRKLHLHNSTTIIVIQPTQSSKQEHNKLTGAKPGITSKQARLVTTHKKRYLQLPLLHNLSWQHLHQPPAPAFALGPGQDNMILDWSTPADTKLYYKAIAALDNKFNGTPEKFIAFLASITYRARQFGWNSILTIPMAMDTRELLSDYGRISMAEINSHATTYTGTQTRAAQNSKMLYHFLMNLVTTEFTTKLVLYQEEYTMNGAPIGACLFKKIIQLTYVDTMATASHICETLMDMHLKLPTFQQDTQKFNDWIHIEVGKLASRGQEANDLLTYL